MDQIKIGRFIAEKRRELGITQQVLAEILNITDRAVSKWENGRSLPDSSIMLSLCDILKISVNDLLSGEVVTMNDYNEKMEQKLIEMVKEKEKSDKRLLTLEIIIGVMSCVVLFIPIFIAAYIDMATWQRVLIMLSGFIPAIVGFAVTLKIEQVAGYYECAHCHHKHVPSYKQVNLAMHLGRTRYMSCPVCRKKSWQKKVINKD